MVSRPPPPAIIRFGSWIFVQDEDLHMNAYLQVAYGGVEEGNFAFKAENPFQAGDYSQVTISVSQFAPGLAIVPSTTELNNPDYLRTIWSRTLGGPGNLSLPDAPLWRPEAPAREQGVTLYNEPLVPQVAASKDCYWGVYEISGTLLFQHNLYDEDVHRVEFGHITFRGNTGEV